MKTKNNMVVHIKFTDEEYKMIKQSAKKNMRTIAKEIKHCLKDNILRGLSDV